MKTHMRVFYIFILLFPILAIAVAPPKQTALSEETSFQVDLGGANASVKIPAGTVVDVVSAGTDRILLKRGKATAEISISATDYASRHQALIDEDNAQKAAAKKAEEDRQAAEEVEKKRQAEEFSAKQAALIEKAGKKPVVTKDPFSGEITIPRAMTREIKNRLKDPDSFKARGVHKLEIVDKNGVFCWEVGITYAAKNSFGGYTVGTASGFMRGSELLLLELGK
jgi:hypothetical protein